MAFKRGEPRICCDGSGAEPRKTRIDAACLASARHWLESASSTSIGSRALWPARASSDFEPMRCKRTAAACRTAQLGDGRPIPERMKAEIGRELDRLALLRSQIAEVEPSAMPCFFAGTKAETWHRSRGEGKTDSPGAQLMKLRGIGPEFAMVLWQEGLYRPNSPIGASWQPTLGWRPAHGKAAT